MSDIFNVNKGSIIMRNESRDLIEKIEEIKNLVDEIKNEEFKKDFYRFNEANRLSGQAFQSVLEGKGTQQESTNTPTTMPSQPAEGQQTFSSKENTLLFWKTKHNSTLGHSNQLMSKNKAILRCKHNNDIDRYCTWKAVTLSDQQLQLITDEQTKKIKEGVSLTHLNPFYPDILKGMNQHRQSHPEPLISPLTGSGSSATFAVTHNGSGNSTTFSKNEQTSILSLG